MQVDAARVDAILGRYPRDKSSLVMVLQDVQPEFSYLPARRSSASRPRSDRPQRAPTHPSAHSDHIDAVRELVQAIEVTPAGAHRLLHAAQESEQRQEAEGE
ncbi:NAD(P)H-dependent oxidoreductase subunit E [archaeon]|nr:NAD(P)H-dependent oxidoreductase subunit E [archaeon]